MNRTTALGPFEVDDVNGFGPRLPETEDGVFRSLGKHGRVGEFALSQPDDGALAALAATLRGAQGGKGVEP